MTNHTGVSELQFSSTPESSSNIRVDPCAPMLDLKRNLDCAISRFNAGDFGQAELEARKILQEHPESAETLDIVAAALLKQHQNEEAAHHYRQLISLKPNYGNAHFNLGVALQSLGDFSSAADHYSDAIDLQPDHHQAYYNRAGILKYSGYSDAAIRDLASALIISPSFAEAGTSLASELEKVGRYEEALDLFSEYPSVISEYKEIGCLFAIGSDQEAINKLQKFREIDLMNLRSPSIPLAAVSAFISSQLKIDDPYPFCGNPTDLIQFNNISDRISSIAQQDFRPFIDSLSDELQERDRAILAHTATRFGSQTPTTLFQNPSPNLKFLKMTIIEQIENYRRLGKGTELPFFDQWPKTWNLDAWFVELTNGGFQERHTHDTAWLSGVFYLEVVGNPVDSEGAIEFSLDGSIYPLRHHETSTMQYNPAPGDLVLFPSSTYHGTIPFYSQQRRLCIAFDLIPTPNNVV